MPVSELIVQDGNFVFFTDAEGAAKYLDKGCRIFSTYGTEITSLKPSIEEDSISFDTIMAAPSILDMEYLEGRQGD